MKLAAQIATNEQTGQLQKNEQLVKIKLRELVFDYTDEVIEVLHKTGVPVSSVLPDEVILTIVVKHLGKNNQLREVISKMLLELDGYYGADGDGKGLAIIGGALTAVGTILASIGKGQQPTEPLDGQRIYAQDQQQQLEQERKRRTILVVVGISIVLLIGAVFAFRALQKSSIKPTAA